jgi:hypothetical protein
VKNGETQIVFCVRIDMNYGKVYNKKEKSWRVRAYEKENKKINYFNLCSCFGNHSDFYSFLQRLNREEL